MKNRLLIIACICFLSSAHAETLQEVLSSDAMNKVETDTDALRRRREFANGWEVSTGIDLQSNFAQLFISEKNAKNLITWSGAQLYRYKALNMFPRQKKEYVALFVTYQDVLGQEVELSILVPHPKYQPMIELGILRDFKYFDPPAFKAVASEKLTLKEFPATLYRHDTGACSLVIKLHRNALINILSNTCSDIKTLFDIANLLDIERLNNKLMS